MKIKWQSGSLLTLWKAWPKRRRRWLVWTAGLVLFYTLLGFVVLPLIVRAVASKHLARELNREVSIQSVRINPYTLSCGIRGLLIKDPDGEPFISWDDVYANSQLASFFGKPWVFKAFSTTNTYVRVQMNKDGRFNFSDLIDKFAQAPDKPQAPDKAREPSEPTALRVDRLSIRGARASLTDMTPRRPFSRVAGPLEITLNNFYTDPANNNPYSFTGSTDSGEVLSWSGHFSLNPFRAAGEMAVANISLNKYAALYEDFVRFHIEDGTFSFRGAYQFKQAEGGNLVVVTNVSAALRSLKVIEPATSNTMVELAGLSIADLSADVLSRRVQAGSLAVTGAVLNLQRSKDASINVVEMAQPAPTATNAPGGILVLLRAVTNVFSALLSSTNLTQASLNNLSVENCSVSFQDESQSKAVKLVLDELNLFATNLSNLPGSNLMANLSLRWNTNGTIKTDVSASLVPLAADVGLHVARLELQPLAPYLESKVNLFVLGSKLGLDGNIRMRAPAGELPSVTFGGDAKLDDFSMVGAPAGEDLVKWRLLELEGIKANLHPPEVELKKIGLHDAFARVALEADGTLNLASAFQPANTNAAMDTPAPRVESAATAQSQEVRELPKFQIGTIAVSNANVRWADQSLMPNVRASLQQINGTLTGLGSRETGNAQLNLNAKVGDTGPVEVTGQFNPFHHKSSEFKVVFREVDLNPTDSYVGKYLGYRLRKGKLSMEVNYAFTTNQLKGHNLVHLDQLTLGEKVTSPDATKLPVKLGIALLKDRSGKIELDVPVEGDLNDPQFRFGRVVWRAVANVFTKIVTSPFAAIGGLLGSGKGEEAGYQEFDPGASELQAAGRGKLDALANALYERPGLEVEIEGQIDSVADGGALRRRKLEEHLRATKWASLRKSEQSTIAQEHVKVEPEERARFVTELHKKTFRKGSPPPDAGKPATKVITVKGSAQTTPADKGATALLQQPAPEERQAALSLMEQQLLETMRVDETDFQILASERAKQVQFYLIQSGKANSDRVYLMQSEQANSTGTAPRAILHLR